MCEDVGNCSFKTGNRRQSEKKTILKYFFKWILKGKFLAPKLRKSADKSLSQPRCSHSNTIYNLQLQKTDSITHAAAAPSNLDASIAIRFAASRRKPARIYTHNQHQMTRVMQPFQCDLQPEIPKHPTTTHTHKHTKAASSRRYTAAKKKKRQTDPSRNRRTDQVPFIAGCSYFTPKNIRFRAPASCPKHSPMQHHAAITMRFAASTRKLAPIYAQNNTRTPDDKSHAAIPMQSATGDSKTPFNYADTSTPKAASSRRYTAAKKNDTPTPAATAAQTRYLSSPAAATLHGKRQGFVLRLPPQNIAPCNIMQPLQWGSQHQLANLHLSTHRTTPEHQMTRVMQPFQ